MLREHSATCECHPLYKALAEARKDSARLNCLEDSARPTMVDGEPIGLAVVITYHVSMELREAIDAFESATKAR